MRKRSRIADEVPVLPGTGAGRAARDASGRDGQLPDGNATESHRARWKGGRSRCSGPEISRPAPEPLKPDLRPRSGRWSGRQLAGGDGFAAALLTGKTPVRLLHGRVQEVPLRLPAQAGRP